MKTVMLLLCILTIGACNKKKDSSVVSVSEFAPYVGTWSKCVSIGQTNGTEFSAASSYLIQVAFTSSGTFQHNRWYFDGVSNCLGGANAISYTQNGTFDVVGTSGTVSGAKDIVFTSASAVVTVRNGATSQFYEKFEAAYIHLNLSGAGGVNGVGSVSDPDDGWLPNASLSFDDFYGPTNVTYNSATINAAGTTLTISDPFDWEMGVGGYPGSATFVMTKQ